MKKKLSVVIALIVIFTMVMSLPVTSFAEMQPQTQEEVQEQGTSVQDENDEGKEAVTAIYRMTAYQEGTDILYDYSASENTGILQPEQITVVGSGNEKLDFQIDEYKIIVDASTLEENQTIYLTVEDETFEAEFTAINQQDEEPADSENQNRNEEQNESPAVGTEGAQAEEPSTDNPLQQDEEVVTTEDEPTVSDNITAQENEDATFQIARFSARSLFSALSNEAYEYKYTEDGTYTGSYISYSGGTTPAKLRMIVDQNGNPQMQGYCLDLSTRINTETLYARTTIGEADYFDSPAQIGSIRAILKNSLPQVTLEYMQTASGVTNLLKEDAVGATQWAIWARTNPDLINPPSANAPSNMERVAYWLYTLEAVGAPYETEPISFTIDSYQEDDTVIFDYSNSTNITALENKTITVTDENGATLQYTDKNNKISVNVAGWTTEKKINVTISGKQTLAGDAYFYKPEGGRTASQSMVAWYEGSNPVKGTASFKFKTSGETELTLTGTKEMVGRHMTEDDQFQFEIKDEDGNTVATGTNDGEDITFTPLKFTKAQVGSTFNYYAVEVNGGQTVDGVTYDNSRIDFSVYVGYSNQKVTTTVKYEKQNGLKFNNCYETESVKVDFQAKKQLEGKPLTAGEYQFTLMNDDGTVIETVTNAADGSINFTPIEYKEAGTYNYTISEVNSGAEGVTYDENCYSVTVVVTDNGKGKLVAEIACDAEELVFNNSYKGVGAISVTKVFLLNDKGTDVDTSFGVGLFIDADCTQKAQYADGSEVANQTIEVTNGVATQITFEGLEYGTYYVAEIGADGAALPEGDVTGKLPQLAYRQEVSYENAMVTLDSDHKISDSTVITNKFYDEGYYKSGKITVTKKVTVNGTPTEATATYYAALFEDEALTSRVTDVKAIVLDGQDCNSVTFDNLSLDTTYYVAETDAAGNVMQSGDFNVETVSVENGAVAVMPETEYESVITNDYSENYWEEEDEEELDEEEEVEDQVQTGDAMNMGFYGALMLIALAAMGITVIRRRNN